MSAKTAAVTQLDTYQGRWSTLLRDIDAIPITPLAAGLPIDSYLDRLAADGVVVISGAVPMEQVQAFKSAHDGVLRLIEPEMEELEKQKIDPSTFYQEGERVVRGLRVRKNAPGRYELKSVDGRDGGELAKEHVSDMADLLVLTPLLRALLERAFAMPWRMSCTGTLPTFPGASGGPWHRDVNELFLNEALDLSLPDYYFNLLVPLNSISTDNGTEFALGSHKALQVDVNALPRGVAAAEPGDIILFNGKTVHRGRPNTSPGAGMRSLVFSVFTARWYEPGREERDPKWLSAKHYED